MRNFFVVLACMTSILLIVACAKSPVDKAMEKIDKSIEKVEKNKDKMTKKDFEALDKEMEEPLKVLNDALENDEVGALDKLKIVGKVTKWAAVLVSAGFKVVGDELGKELKEVQIDFLHIEILKYMLKINLLQLQHLSGH